MAAENDARPTVFPNCNRFLLAGCILAELYIGYPLFPGENEVEQLACIMEICGVPPEELIATATRKRLFFDSRCSPRCVTNSKGRKRRPGTKTLSQALRCGDAAFTDFVARCLEWDPKKRMTPDEAARHEWLQPSGNTSYSHSKSMRESTQENQHHQQQQQHHLVAQYQSQQQQQQQNHQVVSPKSMVNGLSQKYLGRPPHLTPNMVLPDIKSSTICNKYATKVTYKERPKGESEMLYSSPMQFFIGRLFCPHSTHNVGQRSGGRAALLHPPFVSADAQTVPGRRLDDGHRQRRHQRRTQSCQPCEPGGTVQRWGGGNANAVGGEHQIRHHQSSPVVDVAFAQHRRCGVDFRTRMTGRFVLRWWRRWRHIGLDGGTQAFGCQHEGVIVRGLRLSIADVSLGSYSHYGRIQHTDNVLEI